MNDDVRDHTYTVACCICGRPVRFYRAVDAGRYDVFHAEVIGPWCAFRLRIKRKWSYLKWKMRGWP